jgi:HlyD family secretion protein
MTVSLNGKTTLNTEQDWSHATREVLDTLPRLWTRGLLYFFLAFVAITLPWAMLAKVDETGTAQGKLEPQGETIKLDSTATGKVAEIRVKEGDSVKAGQVLLVVESQLVQTELDQAKEVKSRLTCWKLNSIKPALLLPISASPSIREIRQLLR